MGLLKFFLRQRYAPLLAIYSIVIATWGIRLYTVDCGAIDSAATVQTPLFAMISAWIPARLAMVVSAMLFILTAAVTQSIFSSMHPGQSKNYLLHLLVPLFSSMPICCSSNNSIAAALGTLASLYVIIMMLLAKEERAQADLLFRASFAAGLASLIYYPSAALLPSMHAAMAYRNTLSGKRYLITLCAFILPLFFAAIIAFLLGAGLDSYIGITALLTAIRNEWQPNGGMAISMPLVSFCLLLVMLILLQISKKGGQSKTILAAYGSRLLRLVSIFSAIAFVLLPRSNAVPIMVAPAMGSAYVYYFTSKGNSKIREWMFLLVILLLVIGNIRM